MKERPQSPDMPSRVCFREVVLRDGLQNEKILVPLEKKLSLIRLLLNAGIRHLEITSFVHPGKVPAMADAEELCARVPRKTGVVYSALVFNERGLLRAQKAGVDEIAVFVSASETHSRRNMGMGTFEALEEALIIMAQAREAGMRVRAGVSNAFGCNEEGEIPSSRVLDMVERLIRPEPTEIGLADTSGIAHPGHIDEIIPACRELLKDTPLSLHLHNAGGWAFANVLAALRRGVSILDTSLGGTGGCPFLPGAAGNLPTEAATAFLHAMEIQTGIDGHRLNQATLLLEECLQREVCRIPVAVQDLFAKSSETT